MAVQEVQGSTLRTDDPNTGLHTFHVGIRVAVLGKQWCLLVEL